MEYCSKCIIYSHKYDILRQQFYDSAETGENVHFCRMYNENIPERIWLSNTQSEKNSCEYFTPKDDNATH